jgi:hypothetical protein
MDKKINIHPEMKINECFEKGSTASSNGCRTK